MSRGVNKVIIIGNLGADPEVRYAQSGSAITTIRIATSEQWKDKQSGETQERTEWHRVVMYNRLGEIAGEYLRKGSKVFIEGSLRTNKWKDKDGVERYTTEIIASGLQMLDARQGSGGSSAGGMDQMPPSEYQPAPEKRQAVAAKPLAVTAGDQDFDDDIPF